MVLPVIVISLRIVSNFFSFADEDFGIHVSPDSTIFNNWASVGSSVYVAINNIILGHLFPLVPLQVMMIGANLVVVNSLTDLLSHVGTELCN